jgi:hypothetical protein
MKPATPAPHGNPHTSKAPAPKVHGNPHTTTTATTKAHGNPHAATPAGTTATLNPIAQKLQGKPLGTRIEQMLPAGMTLDTASQGFRNQGQFIAAVHVSQNLGIPFANLKTAMLGTPVPGATISPTTPHSLGQAIQELKPSANARTERVRAESQAADDVRVKRPRR